MKTPTPEEAKTPFELFKDKIELHNSQFAHRFPSQCAECSLDRLSIQIFNEAMREYASACAKAAAVKPEEVKDKIKSDIACKRRHNWKSLIEYLIEVKSYDLIDKTIDEAMRDYAEALYKDRIEKAGSELPSQQLINDWCLNESGNSPINSDFGKKVIDLISRIEYTGMYKAANWMKQAASVVIAKERERHPKLVFDEKGMLISGECLKRDLVLFEYESDKFITQEKFEGKKHFISGYNRAFEHLNEILEQKDREIDQQKKEIEELKGEINKRFDWAKNKEQRSLLSSKWNHKRLEEKLSFTETIYCALNEYDEFMHYNYFNTNTKTK